MWQKLEVVISDILLIILSGDLLYLYFAGAWSDSLLIEVAELTVLFSILAWSVIKLSGGVHRLVNHRGQ